jgi:hypothetical protein
LWCAAVTNPELRRFASSGIRRGKSGAEGLRIPSTCRRMPKARAGGSLPGASRYASQYGEYLGLACRRLHQICSAAGAHCES